MKDKKYFFGIDVSLSNTGVAIFDLETKKLVKVTSISTAITKKTGLRDNPNHNNKNMITGIKLKHIYDNLVELKEKFPPQFVVIERGFTRFNNSTQASFRVHGIVNLVFSEVENFYYIPSEIKETIFNSGRAQKSDLANLITERLGYTFDNEDESDATAIGLSWLIKNKKIDWEKCNKPVTKKEKKKSK